MTLLGAPPDYEAVTVVLSREEREALAAVLAYELEHGPQLVAAERSLAAAFIEELRRSSRRPALGVLSALDIPLAIQPLVTTAALGVWEQICEVERSELVRLIRQREQALLHADGEALLAVDQAWENYITPRLGGADPRTLPYPGLEQTIEQVWLTVGRVAAALAQAESQLRLERRVRALTGEDVARQRVSDGLLQRLRRWLGQLTSRRYRQH
ncbi:MAG: hypothetical protein C4289_09035 [Chloroflexota bacterium]